ncbi:MAG: Gfo/Idh/MocA family oxidoreductase [Parcubacteria group bacterium]
MKKIKIAIVGAGAVSELGHMPALINNIHIVTDTKTGERAPVSQIAEIVAVVDTNPARAKLVANKYGIKRSALTVAGVVDEIDAAIIATPHCFHAPDSIALLRNGRHVLVEKPMAINSVECVAMGEAAKGSGAILAVGLMRRFLPGHMLMKSLLATRMIGEIKSFDFSEGDVYDWPVASDFFFRKDKAGGGVLIDTGAHTLDSLIDWLGDYDSVDYRDDSAGGVEADCELRLRMKNGASGTVTLSRIRNLRNTAVIYGERGEIEIGMRNSRLRIKIYGDQPHENRELTMIATPGNDDWGNIMQLQLRDWLESIINLRLPLVSVAEGAKALRLIDECYSKRQRLILPWKYQG